MAQTKIKAGLFEGIIGNGTDGYFLMSNGDGTMTWSQTITPPTISSIDYPSPATAADPAGGETIAINGADFKSGATVTIGGTSAPTVSFVSATQINFTTPAKAAGDYDIVVTNTDGGTATSINGISYNGVPAWTTATGSLGSFASDTTISTITLQASEPDAGTITFSITNGALPTGLSLTGANIDGTTSIVSADTTYNFTVTATDDESQSTGRAFSITIEKYVVVPSEHFTINTYTGNGSTQTIEGKIGTVADFNGSSSRIDLNDDGIGASGTTRETFSVSLWVKITTATQSGIISDYISPNFGFAIQLETTGRLSLWNQYTGSNISSIGTTSINDGSWHHLLVINNTSDNTQKLYIDNSLEIDQTLGTGTKTSSNIQVGYYNISGTPNYFFNGKIDQIRLFNKALSSSEVTTLYGEPNTSSTKSTTDIFNDGSGVVLYDFKDTVRAVGSKPHYLFIGDAGGQSTSVRINSVDAEFTYTRPAGYEEWGGSFDPNNTAYDYQGSANNVTFSENNKKWDKVGSYYHAAWATNGYSSGKYYVELEFLAADLIFGLSTSATANTVHSGASFYDNAITYFSYSANKREYSSTTTAGGAVLTANDVIGFAVDFDNQSLSYYINNTLQDTITLQSYNGTPSNVNFVGTDFEPDLVWIKRRDNNIGATQGFIFDSIRGATWNLRPAINNAQVQDTQDLTAFNSNGFTVGSDVSINGSGGSIAAWAWKAGGAAVSATGTNVNNVSVSANTNTGFSIVKYTGTGYPNSVNSEVPHGLVSAPELTIIKKINSTGQGNGSWVVGTQHLGNGWDGSLYLNSNGTYYNAVNYFWNGAPTSTVVKIKNDWFVNNNGEDYIMYNWHSVEGYQKIGSYTGAGSSGLTVTTGFRPRWVMIKRTDSANDWVIIDSTRDTSDPYSQILWADLTDAEANGGTTTALSFSGTGFSMSTSAVGSSINASGGTYLYLAIA